MTMEDYEHLEDTPDQDEIKTQSSVDSSFAGTLAHGDQSKKANAIYTEREQITKAMRQLAAALDRSAIPAQKTLTVASQCITRTVIVTPGPVCSKLVSNHDQRSSLKLSVYGESPQVFISTMPISGNYSGVSAFDIPASSIVIDQDSDPYSEIRTTGELWAMLPSSATKSVIVCIVEEFVS